MTDAERPVVLIAEDEQSVAEGYEIWLGGQYDVRLAADGQEALDIVDETVDVALLDRMMPKKSGEQVLAAIREQGIDCRVVMVTAVEPDFDIIEMGFDAYITKPPERAELTETIEKLLERATLDDAFQEYHSLMARKGALETQKTAEELDANDQYQELLDRIEQAEAKVDAGLGDMSSEADFVGAVREIEGEDPFTGGDEELFAGGDEDPFVGESDVQIGADDDPGAGEESETETDSGGVEQGEDDR